MKTFITNIFNAISNNLVAGGAYYQIARGVLVTLLITVTAWVLAAAIGAAVSYLMCYEKKIVSNIGRGLCFVFRSVPVLTAVWLLYYGVFGGGRGSSALIVGVAVGFWGAGHASEVLARAVVRRRKELSSTVVDKLENVYFSAVIPQALEDSLYDLKRLAVHIMQWTVVAGYISVNDLTQVMYDIGHRTMYPFFSIFFTAILYMIATLLIEWVFSVLEKLFKDDAEDEEEKPEQKDEENKEEESDGEN